MLHLLVSHDVRPWVEDLLMVSGAVSVLVEATSHLSLHGKAQVVFVLALSHVVVVRKWEMANFSMLGMLSMCIVLRRFVDDTERLESTN